MQNIMGGGKNYAIQSKNQPSKAGVSCLVIKPHILKELKTGEMIDAIFQNCRENNVSVLAMEQFNLTTEEVEEFLEVYKGVLPEYGLLVEEMKNGNLIAIVVRGEMQTIQTIRSMCGPNDPQIAKAIRAESLRSRFGKNKVQNGIHCTDLEDDGILESEFFFSVMQKA